MSPNAPSSRIFTSLAAGLILVGCGAVGSPAEAQGRAVPRRTARPVRTTVIVGGFYGPSSYYSPYWYGAPYWSPYWYGGPWLGYQYPYPPYRYDSGSAIRLEVTPREAEVYVDGYYAGIVDDFDGVFQRLRVTPGEHEITLYRDGFRTTTHQVSVAPRATFRIRDTLMPLAAGEVADPRPAPSTAPAPQPESPQPAPGARRDPGTPRPPTAPDRPARASAYGTLAVRVQPADATVLIDGERWDRPELQERLLVEVPEGTHRVEVGKPGYEPFATDVLVRRGETTPLNVSLRSN